MLSYKQFLLEKFAAAGKDNYGEYYEVFVNPTIKEIDDEFRFIIDLENKNVFVSDVNLLHVDMIKFLKKNGYLENFNYNDYLKKGIKLDKILTMATDGDNYVTDSVTDMIYNSPSNIKEQIKDKARTLVNADYSWIKFKWFDHNKLQRGLDEVREML